MPRFTRGPVKLVVSIDVGTTFTAASYHVLGNAAKMDLASFQEVNRWPSQVYPDAKIPSVLYYDSLGVARLHGAETLDEIKLLFSQTEENSWEKAEWWKLRLRPEYLPSPSEFPLPSLPSVTTVDDVFQDQFAYVIKNVREFYIKANVNGEKHWQELAASMDIVLTVPNGWEGKHQHRMRLAAMQAKLVQRDKGSNVKFVSEGEAAVHYCLDSIRGHSVKVGSIIMVCDAGGGTTDICVYEVTSMSPVRLEEVVSPQSFIAGGVFVNQAFEKFLRDSLKGSRWDSKECIQTGMEEFEQRVKRRFRADESKKMHLRLGGSQQDDVARKIDRGRLCISRDRMVKFFEPTVKMVKAGLKEFIDQCKKQGMQIEQIFVVGGFAESHYVYSEIQKMTAAYDIPIGKPDGPLSKAIAHGALNWRVNSSVQVRMARLHYGAETDIEFNPNDPNMIGRAKFQNHLGQWKVRHAWSSIVKKNQKLKMGQEHLMPFHHAFHEGDDLEVEMELYAFRFQKKPPMFFKDKDGQLVDGFIHLGTVRADLSKCFETAKPKVGPSGRRYKMLEYCICLLFDEIEIRARLRWKVDQALFWGEATIAYDV